VASTTGESYDLVDPTNLADPYPLYARLREQGRVHWSESLGGWALTRYDDVRPALSANDLSNARFMPYLERLSSSPDADPIDKRLFEGLSQWFTFSDPPGHTRLATLTRRAFTPKMKAMGPHIDQMIDDLLDRLPPAGTFDLIGDVARPLSLGAITDLLGAPPSDHDDITDWSDALTAYIGGALNIPDRRQRAYDGMIRLDAYLREMIEVRRRTPMPDVMGRLTALGDEITDDEIVGIASSLLFAGHGTTTNLIGNGVLALLRNPEQLERLRRQPELVPLAIEELLRYDSPVHITVRVAAQAGAAGISEAQVGDRIFLMLAAANRDPREFDEPDRLDVLREDNRHVSFGYGVHFCLGAPLARMEAPTLFARLLERFPALRRSDELDLVWQPTVGFRGLVQLPLTVG
jgi:cytochrome P450